MKTVSITTPENIEVTYRLAGAGSRVVAAFVDYFIQGMLYFLILLSVIGMQNPIDYLQFQSSFFLALVLLIIAMINYGYFTILEMTMQGQTLGKKLVGIKTIRKNGQPMDISHSLIRNLFRIFIDNYMIGILMIFLRDDYARLGDLFSSTMVIEEEKGDLSDVYIELHEDLERKLTEEEKELLVAYSKVKEKIELGREELQERLINYFNSQYNEIDTEIVGLIKKHL
ncbi:Uncharacterized membrane protein YckC, RDD family [Anaerovirgula multivorans]|uniref:Uncharacterized membrane protein YckC, RDD family n=1 Tax=Anaerovirgula multivorans TaxID=312168 RepID=A0A239FV96_9FIRM|nr:RDD family protein [Anaerovirgula multivorans]SNS59844.1 Uncharacterized membrane protein YckC, RDD family [Anaerovirgula multivorans]